MSSCRQLCLLPALCLVCSTVCYGHTGQWGVCLCVQTCAGCIYLFVCLCVWLVFVWVSYVFHVCVCVSCVCVFHVCVCLRVCQTWTHVSLSISNEDRLMDHCEQFEKCSCSFPLSACQVGWTSSNNLRQSFPPTTWYFWRVSVNEVLWLGRAMAFQISRLARPGPGLVRGLRSGFVLTFSSSLRWETVSAL